MPGIGDLIVGGIAPIQSSALEVAHNFANVGGGMTALTVLNFATAARMILFIDTASATQPANGAVAPIYAFPIAAGTSGGPPTGVAFDWTLSPIQFKKGLWVILSTVLTTPFTLTAGGSTDGTFSGVVNLS